LAKAGKLLLEVTRWWKSRLDRSRKLVIETGELSFAEARLPYAEAWKLS
jgi:hypothetical protein